MTVAGPVKIACTPLATIAETVVTSIEAVAEATGQETRGPQFCCPLSDPHAPAVSMASTSDAINRLRTPAGYHAILSC